MRNRSKTGPLKLALLLLYGQHKWLERTGPTLRMPNVRLAGHFRTRTGRMREYLYELENMGIITHLRWNKAYTTCQVAAPVGMEFSVGESIDV